MREFTYDWFSSSIPNLRRWLQHFAGKPVRALEIGCFEGMSTTWFLDNILTNPESSIHCVDTFKGSDEHSAIDFAAIKARFLRNTEGGKRVNLHVGCSTEIVSKFDLKFDFAYIDGSHRASDVYADASVVWPKMKINGMVIFDDYLWDYYKQEDQTPKHGIDRFCSEHTDSVIVERCYQLAIVKSANKR